MGDDDRILSMPVRVRWAGFESDTYSLQKSGWSISAYQDMIRQGMQIMLKHEGAQMYGMSELIDWRYTRRGPEQWGSSLPVIHFNIMGRHVQINMTGKIDWGNFKPIDAKPQWTNKSIQSLEDLVHFAPALVRTREIILPEESVPELMDRILKLQQPGREAELKRQLQEDRRGMVIGHEPRQKFHAQILSIA